jgi:hypothetical protein
MFEPPSARLLCRLGLAMIVGLAAPAAARAAETAPAIDAPAPPASLDRKAVDAWAAKYVRPNGWIRVNFDKEGIRLATPKGVSLMSDGLVETEIRHELFSPISLPDGEARSGLAHWAVDCAHQRFAVLSMTVYAHNNLQGEVARHAFDRHHWQDPVDSEFDTLRVVCASVVKGKRLPTPKPHAPPPPKSAQPL